MKRDLERHEFMNECALESFGLKRQWLDSSVLKEENGIKVLYIKLKQKKQRCPRCGHKHTVSIGYYERTLKGLNLVGSPVLIKYKQRNYRCKCCKRKFIERNKVAKKHSELSNKAKNSIVKDISVYGKTFLLSAREHYLSPTTIIRHFDKHRKKEVSKIQLGRVILLDEFRFSRKNPKYSFIMFDYERDRVAAILKDRRLDQLRKYISLISLKERLKVEIIVADLWRPFKMLVEEFFPNAKIIADRFHYTRYLTKAIMRCRIDLQNDTLDKQMKKNIKKYWRLFQKPFDKLEGECFDFKARKMVTIKELVMRVWKLDSKFEELCCIYNWFVRVLDNYEFNEKTATTFIDGVIYRLLQLRSPEVKDIIIAFTNWKEEIVNSLSIKFENGKFYTNGKIEGVNNLIKTIYSRGFNFRNRNRFAEIVTLNYNNNKEEKELA